MLDKFAEKNNFKLTEENGFDELGRPVRDLYYMNLCFNVNIRSIDKSSKCGCVAVHEDGAILSTGYNNPIRGADDKDVPQTRPEKYDWMEHSERNVIYNASRHGIELNNCTFYITGFPCIDCLRAMIQSGAKKIVYGPNVTVMMDDKDRIALYEKMLKGQTIVIKRFKYDNGLYSLNPFSEFVIDEKKKQGIAGCNFQWNVYPFTK